MKKTVLLDTIDKAGAQQFLENLTAVLGTRPLDYLVINHMEPDHCALIEDVVRDIKMSFSLATKKPLSCFINFMKLKLATVLLKLKKEIPYQSANGPLSLSWRRWCTGLKLWSPTLNLIRCYLLLMRLEPLGPSLNGNIFADQVDFATEWLDDFRRYYANIIGKYGPQTRMLLKKLSRPSIFNIFVRSMDLFGVQILSISLINIKTGRHIHLKKKGVVIAFGSVYGNTEEVVDVLAAKLSELGVKY